MKTKCASLSKMQFERSKSHKTNVAWQEQALLRSRPLLHPPFPMQTLRRHMNAATVTGCVLALGASIAIAAAASNGRGHLYAFLHTFDLAAPNEIRDARNPFAGANFDIASLMAHPCYEIVGIEAQMCTDNYGLEKSLHAYVDDGTIMKYAKDQKLIVSASGPSAQPTTQPVVTLQPIAEPTVEFTQALNQKTITERSHMLWNACRGIAGSMKDATSCYQRNVRLLSRFDVSIEGNIN